MTAPFAARAFTAILIGDESLTIACGDMVLAGGHALTAVVTRDDAVRGWAEGQGLRVLDSPRDLMGSGIAAEWLLSIANLRLIPDTVLALPARGAINFHDGPLPRYAGLNTPAWAIINGEASHGVSWHVIEGGVDEGDLLAQQTVEITPDETAFSLNAKCYAAGLESFSHVVSQLESGTLHRTPQDLDQRRYFTRDQRPARMGVLDFTASAEVLDALARGLDFGAYANPLTNLKVMLGNRLLRVGALAVAQDKTSVPGTVLAVTDNSLTVATATTPVTLRGLTDMRGRAVDPSALIRLGEVIAAPDLPELALKNEGEWAATLTAAEPISVPLSDAADGPPDFHTLALRTPETLDVEEMAHAAALVGLDSAGMTTGLIAVTAGTMHPLAADWLPLPVETDALLAELADDFATALERARHGAMAADILLRTPALDPAAMPQMALSFADAPLAGAAVSVVLGADTPRLIYDAARMTPQAARIIAARLEAGFAAYRTATTCDEVRALPVTEVHLLRETWNATARAYERITIHAAFEAQAARTPEVTALVFENETLTYAALNARANRLAHTLRDMGAAPGTPIGLKTKRGVDLLVGALGILKAGGAYVPLDPGYPAERIAHYIADSAAPIIVTQSDLCPRLPDHAAEVILIDTDARLTAAPDTNPDPTATPDDLAYLIYTSGSTGTPKGVMVSHGNVANFFAGMDDRIDHKTGAVWLAVTSLSFDISVLELFWTLARGFKLILAGDGSRTMVSNGPVATSERAIDFNLFYWGNDDGVGPKKYELLLEGAKFADAHGFNAVWTPERHFHAFGGPYPNPSVTGAAVAAVTQNLDIRAGSCVAPLHHPARIAEEWAVIDNLTNGRVGLAIASGWQPDDFVLRPENTPPENKPAMYAAIEQLRRLWAGEAVEFAKRDGTRHAVVTQPRPVSKRLPIWVTTAGNPQTWKEAGEIGANVLTHLLGQSVEEVAGKIEIYHQALRKGGHDPADFKVTVMLHTYLADTRAQAEEIAREPMKDYLRSAAGLIKQYAWAFPAFKKPVGATNPFEIDLGGLSAEEMDAILDFAFQRYFNDSGLFGTVVDGLARAEQLKRIGVDEIACLIDYGIAPDLVLEGLKPLAEVLQRANQETVLAQDDFSLAAQIVRHGVSHLQCTPSMAHMLVTNDETRAALGRVKHLMVGGEALPGRLVAALQSATSASLQNMYGPTETTIWSTTQMLDGAEDVTAPIGSPIANTQVFILDDKMRPQPVGVAGKVWIGGEGVTKGYWRRGALTAERFMDNDLAPGKLYDTGDLAWWDAQGVLHFIGRADAQVKIRGHRIEPGEIEARMAELPGVTQAVVVARDGPGGAQLVGYATTSETFDEAAALRQLADDLPAIMVPTAIVPLATMPLTPNRKIDRKALPAPMARNSPAERATPAESDTQERIAAIWTALLGEQDIRGDDNFFALGGHSLLAVQAHRDIRVALGAENLSITDIFRFPTLAGLAAHLDKGQGGGRPAARTSAPKPVETAAPRKPEVLRETAQIIARRRQMRARRGRENA